MQAASKTDRLLGLRATDWQQTDPRPTVLPDAIAALEQPEIRRHLPEIGTIDRADRGMSGCMNPSPAGAPTERAALARTPGYEARMSVATIMLCGVIATFGIVAAVFAFLGTGGQAYASVRQLKEFDPEAHRVFVAVDDLNNEFSSLRHPFRRSLRRREVRQLLKDSPEEARLYRKVMWQIGSWSLLTVASLFSIVVAVWR